MLNKITKDEDMAIAKFYISDCCGLAVPGTAETKSINKVHMDSDTTCIENGQPGWVRND
jgi:hypothetical protein